MEGPVKRLRDGQDLSFGALWKLPRDLRVYMLIRLKNIWDLFNFGKVNEDVKDFLKENRVFERWFCHQLGFDTTEEGNAFLTFACYAMEFKFYGLGVQWETEREIPGWARHHFRFHIRLHMDDFGIVQYYTTTVGIDKEVSDRYLKQAGVIPNSAYTKKWQLGIDYRSVSLEGTKGSDPFPVQFLAFLKTIKKLSGLLPSDYVVKPWGAQGNFKCSRPFHLAALFKSAQVLLNMSDDDDHEADPDLMSLSGEMVKTLNQLERGQIRVSDVSDSGVRRPILSRIY